ncbi:hypothetical protein ACN9M0_07660 [Streptomyces sp. R-07]|uniref:hypothetical protein n=1 Tax=Streptomyces sp. R-07 TaxID=3404052 RepID=UPI003CF57EC0
MTDAGAHEAVAHAVDRAAARPPDPAAAHAVHPGDLPGVRAQVRAVAADLAAGRNCLWLVTDALVESGLADELYRGALFAGPVRVDVPAPAAASTRAREPEPGFRGEDAWGWDDDSDELPYLDLPDDGFDLDLGWSLESRPPRVPAPRQEPAGTRHDPEGLLARLGKELSVDADEAVAALVAPGGHRRPVVGIRAWTEEPAAVADRPAVRRGYPRTESRGGWAQPPVPGTAEPSLAMGIGPTPARGAAVARLFRALAAARRPPAAGRAPPAARRRPAPRPAGEPPGRTPARPRRHGRALVVGHARPARHGHRDRPGPRPRARRDRP